MLNGYHLLTLTHREAPLETIGQSVLRGDDIEGQLSALKERFQWEELCYLATCNRVIYLFYSPVSPQCDLAADVLSVIRPEMPTADIQKIAGSMRLLHGGDVVRHLFEVAASMDSLVVGEREILRQLRTAFEYSRDGGLSGDHLRLLLHFTIETAKEIYTATGIGEKALSIVALAFAELQKTGLQPDARIVLIGAGQTNTLFAKFLKKYGYRRVTIFNRSLDKAEELAGFLNGQAFSLDDIELFSEGFDALVVCTGATEPVVDGRVYRSLLKGEKESKVVVDLSIPKNVAAEVVDTFRLQYIEIESLRDAARDNLAFRERERAKADLLLNDKVRLFRERWHERQVERSLAPVVEAAKNATQRAQQVFSREFDRLDAATRDLVLRMMGYVEQKSVAAAMRTVREVSTRAARHLGEREVPATEK